MTEKKSSYPGYGYVYRIYWPDDDDSYVGSTNNIDRRMNEHHKPSGNPNSLVSKKIKECDGCFEHEIIDTLWCETERDACEREREWQDLLDPSLCENRAFVTKEELKKERILKYENNKKHELRMNAEWNKNNKEQHQNTNSEWYIKNRERKLRMNAEWKKNNKEYRAKEAKRSSERITCECGSEVSRGWLTNHKKTMKHKTFVAQN